MISLDASSVLLQWATGGLLFLWVTTRHRVVGAGYGWLLRVIYLVFAASAFGIGVRFGFDPIRDLAALGVAVVSALVLGVSVVRRGVPVNEDGGFDPRLDLIGPAIGLIGLVGAGLEAGGPVWLSLGRMVVGALFMGAVSDAMLLGHWYLVQPGLSRDTLIELVKWTGLLWLPETLLFLFGPGMVAVWAGTVDDHYNGMLGWFWGACVVTTMGLLLATMAALKEKHYSAVMAATGLLYLAILTGFGIDLVARAILA